MLEYIVIFAHIEIQFSHIIIELPNCEYIFKITCTC